MSNDHENTLEGVPILGVNATADEETMDLPKLGGLNNEDDVEEEEQLLPAERMTVPVDISVRLKQYLHGDLNTALTKF